MSVEKSNQIFKHVLAWMRDKNIETSKIAIQKTLFFLKECGIPMRFEFDAYTYGPFSKQIMDAAKELEYAEKITISHSDYELASSFTDTLPEKEKTNLDEKLNKFTDLINRDFSFDNMELFGTVLYCIRALQENGMEPDSNDVIQEFQAWKGTRYSDKNIENAYGKLYPVFSEV